MLLQAITDGFVIVEREGISVKYPCRPMLIATLNPADSELKDVFLDRIGPSPLTHSYLHTYIHIYIYVCLCVCATRHRVECGHRAADHGREASSNRTHPNLTYPNL